MLLAKVNWVIAAALTSYQAQTTKHASGWSAFPVSSNSGPLRALVDAWDKGLRYPSDLTDAEWAIVEPLIPPARHGGRKRSVNVREVLNGIFYVLWTGCQWRAFPKIASDARGRRGAPIVFQKVQEVGTPSGRPRSTAGRLLCRGRFLQMHVFTHNEHRVTGYRTLAALASDSPPRRPLLRRACQDPARPDPPRQAATALGAPRVPATETRQPSPAPGSLRRSSHFGSRSAPSRAALLAWLMAESSWAFPLDRALCGRPTASVAERCSGTGRHY